MYTSAAYTSTAAERRTGFLLLLTTALIWGVNWPVAKLIVSELPPFTARGGAGIGGAALAFLAARARGERLGLPAAQAPRVLLLALLNVTSWIGLSTLALLWLPASETAILAYTMPIWSVAFAWPLLGERPSAARTSGLALGLLGVTVLIAGQPLGTSRAQWPGILCVLAAAAFWALGTVLSKRLPLRLPPIVGTAWQILAGTVPLTLVGLLLEPADSSRVTLLGWAALGYNGAFSFGLAYVTWFGALRRLPASTAAVGTLLIPVIGVLSAALLLGEPFGLRQIAALMLTLAGVALATRMGGGG
jgi:drug/metabolite transporter (DMT)-like permease